MNIERIELTNGEVITLTDVYLSVSGSLFHSPLHYDICNYIAKQSNSSGLLRKVIENLYSSKSRRIRLITAVVWFVEFRRNDISQIFVLQDIESILKFRGTYSKKVVGVGSYPGEYIDKKHLVTLLFKSIVHHFFRFFSKDLPPNSVIIRGWVDVTESMYSKQINSSRLRIFPFPLGFKRQLQFINSCRIRNLNFDLDGLPYSISSIIKVLFLPNGMDKAIASIEISANQKYAYQLLKSKVSTVYTSDEFEAGAISMYELLLAADVKVVNTAHGIGLYCPYVAYTEFIGFTQSQGNFYYSRNSSIQVSVRDRQNSILPLLKAEDAKKLPLVFVLLHQNFDDYGLQTDARMLREIAYRISNISEKLGIPFYIKLHPNSSPSKVRELIAEVKGIPVVSWLDISMFRAVFITINSTALFDTLKYGPTLVFKDASYFPEVFYGSDIIEFKLDDLEHKLASLVDPENWIYSVKYKK